MHGKRVCEHRNRCHWLIEKDEFINTTRNGKGKTRNVRIPYGKYPNFPVGLTQWHVIELLHLNEEKTE